MKRCWLFTVAVAVLLAPLSAGAQGQAPTVPKVNPSWNKRLWPTERNATFAQMAKEPTRLFDNLYSIGFTPISPFLITTNAGLVLIDTGWPETFDLLTDNIRKVGFDPANIKYIFVTHARVDHYGAAGRFKEMVPGLRVGMPLADWEDAERQYKEGTKGQENSVPAPLSRDLVINDNEALRVGDTTFKFYVTPGTTPGALSIDYQVKDGGRSYRALLTGGVAMYGPAQWGEAYIKSVERLKALGPWDVLLPNHPFMAQPKDLGEIERDMASHRPGSPHPAVAGPARINAFFDLALRLAREKRALEQKATQ